MFYGMLGVFFCQGTQAQSVIDLSKPVGESLETITGIYYQFDSVTGTTTPDASGNNYTGNLDAGENVSLPSLTGGVNLPGASGFGTGLELYSPSTATGNLNRVYVNLGATNNLGMVATDFTAGMWLRLDSVSAGTQKIILMDRGGMNANSGVNGGQWGFFLDKDTNNEWRIGFQVGDGASYMNGYHNDLYQNLSLQNGTWHHLGFTYDYIADDDNVVTFWLNGESIGSASFNLDITSGHTNATVRRFSIGDRSTSNYFTTYFDGAIDDLFVTTGLHTFQTIPEPGIGALIILGGGTFFAGGRKRKTA